MQTGATVHRPPPQKPRGDGLALLASRPSLNFCSGFPSSPAIHGRQEDSAAPSAARREGRDQRKNHALTAPLPPAADEKIDRRKNRADLFFRPTGKAAAFQLSDAVAPYFFHLSPRYGKLLFPFQKLRPRWYRREWRERRENPAARRHHSHHRAGVPRVSM